MSRERRRRDAGPEHEAALARIQERIRRPSGPRMVVARGTQWSEHAPTLPDLPPGPGTRTPEHLAKVGRLRWYGAALGIGLLVALWYRAPHALYALGTAVLLVPFVALAVIVILAVVGFPGAPPVLRWAIARLEERLR